MELKDVIYCGDCIQIMKQIPDKSIAGCITDPPYNYEFIGRNWDTDEIKRRTQRVQNSSTLVKNIPYGSGLAGGVRNSSWYKKTERILLIIKNGVKNGERNFIALQNRAHLFLFLTAHELLHKCKLQWKMLVFTQEI